MRETKRSSLTKEDWLFGIIGCGIVVAIIQIFIS